MDCEYSRAAWAGLLRLKDDYHCCSELSLSVQPKCYLCCNNAFRFPKTLRTSLCYILLTGDCHWPVSCQNKDKCIILWTVQLMKLRSIQIWSLCVYPFPECSLPPLPTSSLPLQLLLQKHQFLSTVIFFAFLRPSPRPGAEPTPAMWGWRQYVPWLFRSWMWGLGKKHALTQCPEKGCTEEGASVLPLVGPLGWL